MPPQCAAGSRQRYRSIYLTNLDDAVYVLHVFMKKRAQDARQVLASVRWMDEHVPGALARPASIDSDEEVKVMAGEGWILGSAVAAHCLSASDVSIYRSWSVPEADRACPVARKWIARTVSIVSASAAVLSSR